MLTCYETDNVASVMSLPIQNPGYPFISCLNCLRTLNEALKTHMDHQKKKKVSSSCSWLISVQMSLGLQVNNFLAEFRSSLSKLSGREKEMNNSRQLDFINKQFCIFVNYLALCLLHIPHFPTQLLFWLELQLCWASQAWPWLWTSLWGSRRAFLLPLPGHEGAPWLHTQAGLARAPTFSLDGSLREGLMLGFTRLSLAFVMDLPTVIPLILILANHSHRQR